MKHFVFIVMMAAGLIASNVASAQKTGYISIGELIQSMPEYKKAEVSLREFGTALGEKYTDMVNEFNTQEKVLSGPDTAKLTKAQIDVKRKSLQELYAKLTGWNESSREEMGEKEQQLLAPIQKKAIDAVNAVAKEAGYSYIFNKEAIIVSPPADDILPLVKKKLAIQ